jgi:adenosyl cobinamide kinase/adenosyl cobinamide phosphate guanylyltransferase
VRILVLGGISSGKSAYAEGLLTGGAGSSRVSYLATAADRPGDVEWAARVAAHRARRPAGWRTVEPTPGDLPAVLADAVTDGGPAGGVLVEDLSTWLAGVHDDAGLWDRPADRPAAVDGPVHRLLAALEAAGPGGPRIVLVSAEVGLTLVPTTAAGRAFADALGELNQRVATVVDEVVLVVAGLPVPIKPPGTPPSGNT